VVQKIDNKREIEISNNPKCLIIQKQNTKISRNEKCDATGKKFKNCCGAL
jgi:preprotein translocase subunit SecA